MNFETIDSQFGSVNLENSWRVVTYISYAYAVKLEL